MRMTGCGALIKAIDAYLAKADDDLKDALGEAGFAEPKDTAKGISSLEAKIAAALVAETAYVRNKAKKASSLEALAKEWPNIIEGDDIDETLSEILLDEFDAAIPDLANTYIKKIDPELAVETMTERTLAWARSWSEEFGAEKKVSFHETIGDMLESCLKNGDSVADFTRQILEGKVRDEYYEARRIAVTETLRAHSVAQQEAIAQNPAVDRKEWRHTGAQRNEPRPNHVAMDGQTVGKDEPFTLAGADGATYYPMYPRDPDLPPGESVNCHCIHQGIADDDILGLPLEERKAMQQAAIDEDDGEWEKELDAQNKAKAGIK